VLKERLRRVPEQGARYLQQTLWRGFNPPAPADWEPQLYGLSESNRQLPWCTPIAPTSKLGSALGRTCNSLNEFENGGQGGGLPAFPQKDGRNSHKKRKKRRGEKNPLRKNGLEKNTKGGKPPLQKPSQREPTPIKGRDSAPESS